MRYRPEIDGLRALAVVPVILFHAGFDVFAGGFVGVDVFFVISGYLITSIVLADLEKGAFSLGHFYARRARRILPALFTVMAVCLPFAWAWLAPADLERFARSVIAVSTFSSNILFWRESGYFDAAAELKPLLHTWSLAIEEQYYLLFPVLMLLLWRHGRKGRDLLPLVLAALFAASLLLAVSAATLFPHPQVISGNFYLLPTRAWELLLGALAAFRLHRTGGAGAGVVGVPGHKASDALALTGIGLIAFSILSYDEATPFPGLYALPPTVGALLVILFARPDARIGAVLGARAPVAIGLASYSAYLWHQPLFAFARHRGLIAAPDREAAPVAALLCLLVVPLAWASWRFVEQPFRDRRRVGSRAFVTAAVMVGVAFIALGLLVLQQQGNVWRYSDAQWEIVGNKERRDDYVWARMNRLTLAPFEEDAERRVLVIGDSNAGDLVNAFFEAGAAERWSFSTFRIPHACANLAIDEARFIDHLEASERARCRRIGWYRDERLRARLDEATLVVLASSWEGWQAGFLIESVARLTTDHGDKFVVFGTKHFERDLDEALRLDKVVDAGLDAGRDSGALADARAALRMYPRADDAHLNAALADALDERLIDPYRLLCDSDACPLFDEHGRIISYDDFHLTRAGARLLGERILALSMFR